MSEFCQDFPEQQLGFNFRFFVACCLKINDAEELIFSVAFHIFLKHLNISIALCADGNVFDRAVHLLLDVFDVS